MATITQKNAKWRGQFRHLATGGGGFALGMAVALGYISDGTAAEIQNGALSQGGIQELALAAAGASAWWIGQAKSWRDPAKNYGAGDVE